MSNATRRTTGSMKKAILSCYKIRTLSGHLVKMAVTSGLVGTDWQVGN